VAGGALSRPFFQLFVTHRAKLIFKEQAETTQRTRFTMNKLVALFAALLLAGAVSAAVNINTATKSELEALPEVGPVRAQAIIDYRTKNGNFKTLEDVKKVDGIGDKIFAENKDKISLSGPTKIDWEVKKPADASKKDAPKADAGKKEAPAAAASAKDAPKKDDMKKEAAPTKDAAKKEEPKKDAAPAKKEMTKEEKAAEAKAKKEEAKKKAAEEKAKKADEKKKKAEEAKAKKEAEAKAKKEAAAKKDAPKKDDAAKKDAPTKDAAKKEEPKK
jgi:competence protein ComEA